MVEHALNMPKVMGSISSIKAERVWGSQEIRQIQTGRALGKGKQQQSSQVPSNYRETVSSWDGGYIPGDTYTSREQVLILQ